jgi:hypothetical protein
VKVAQCVLGLLMRTMMPSAAKTTATRIAIPRPPTSASIRPPFHFGLAIPMRLTALTSLKEALSVISGRRPVGGRRPLDAPRIGERPPPRDFRVVDDPSAGGEALPRRGLLP